MHEEKINNTYLYFIVFISALGGFLFGYDWVVIGGAKPFYEKFFNITDIPRLQGWAMSSALLGCLLGSIISGLLSDKYGRKRLLIFAALLFIFSAYGTGAINSFDWFVFYRILGGIGIGLASNLSPIYIAEISPQDVRGKLVSINQFTIVIGILAAQITNWQIAELVPIGASNDEILNSWNGQFGWRWMFRAELVPATLFLIFLFFIPESPRWLVKNNYNEKAKKILSMIGNAGYTEKEYNQIRNSLKNETKKVNFKYLLDPSIRKILFIGIILAAFQQWCGINVIFNYAEEVFTAAGYGVSDMLFNIVITGSVNLAFTLVAIYTVDKIGRRILMIMGSSGLAVIYFLMGSAYYFKISGWPLLILVVLAIACYAVSLAPVTWVILSEIFPNKIRGAAMSVATVSLWVASFFLVYTFPILNNYLFASGTFWLYGGICIAGLTFILKNLIETKGKSLEMIEKELTK